MYTVTEFVKNAKQPQNGLLPLSLFNCGKLSGECYTKILGYKTAIKDIDDELKTNYDEDISPSLIGRAVDYLCRYFILGNSDAFAIPFMGAKNVKMYDNAMQMYFDLENDYKKEMKDDTSNLIYGNFMYALYNLVNFDEHYRSGTVSFNQEQTIIPNITTLQHTLVMAHKTLRFFQNQAYQFENRKSGVYAKKDIKTNIFFDGALNNCEIYNADADYITPKTLWDLKTSKHSPTKNDTLQLILYYILGLHSNDKKTFKKIENFGIINPRLGKYYTISIDNIDKSILNYIENSIYKSI